MSEPMELKVEQGSPEWHAARLGHLTASRMHDAMKRLKNKNFAASRKDYAIELVCERLTGEAEDFFTTREMQWGIEHEDEAAQMYAFTRDVEPIKCGLFKHPSKEWVLASPDRLIAANDNQPDGLIEIKCPKSATHAKYLLTEEVPPEYVSQVHLQLVCTGRQWCDFVSFDPRMPGNAQLFVQRLAMTPEERVAVERDIDDFLREVAEMEHAIDNRMAA
jgi:exodeoxyribonuclease (lambda-induced)